MNISKAINEAINRIKIGSENTLNPPEKPQEIYIFIDLDNTSWAEVGKLDFNESTNIIFYADEQHAKMLKGDKMNNKIRHTCAKVDVVEVKTGRNASDFMIICDVTRILAERRTKYIYVVSKDTDYDEVLDKLRLIYTGEIIALEKFASVDEVKADLKFMTCKTLDEAKNEIAMRYKEYRREIVMELLNA